MTALRHIKTLCCLLSLFFAATVTASAQSGTSSPKTSSAEDTITQTTEEYAGDNVRMAQAVKLSREVRLMRAEVLDLIERRHRLDSINKTLETEIAKREYHLANNKNFIGTLQSMIKKLDAENQQLRVSNQGQVSKWEQKAKRPFVVGAGGAVGYDVLTGRRSYIGGVFVGIKIATF